MAEDDPLVAAQAERERLLAEGYEEHTIPQGTAGDKYLGTFLKTHDVRGVDGLPIEGVSNAEDLRVIFVKPKQ